MRKRVQIRHIRKLCMSCQEDILACTVSNLQAVKRLTQRKSKKQSKALLQKLL